MIRQAPDGGHAAAQDDAPIPPAAVTPAARRITLLA